MAVLEHHAKEPAATPAVVPATAATPAIVPVGPGLLLDGLSPEVVLSLQRTAGNRAVSRLLAGRHAGGEAMLARDPAGAVAPAAPPPVVRSPSLKGVSASLRFTIPEVRVGDLLVRFTGSLSIGGKGAAIGASVPKKLKANDVSQRLQAAVAADVAAATATGTSQHVELAIAGRPLVIDLVPGAENASPFVAFTRFTAAEQTVTFADCEAAPATVTLEIHAWITPQTKAPAGGEAAPPAMAISDASVSGFTYGGKAGLMGGGKSAGVRAESALAQVGTTFEDVEQRVGTKLPENVKKYYGSPEQRVAWLQEMEAYFGSDAGTFAHFSKIRPAKVEGHETWLHENAASRLEAVQAEIGKAKMPKSGGVGWPRRECELGRAQDLGSLHNLGYAVDYNAYHTPHLKDRRQLDLISIVAGRSAEMDFGPNHPKRIQELDVTNGAHSPEKQAQHDALLAKVRAEFRSMAKASEEFRGSLKTEDEDLGAEFQELRKQWYDDESAETDAALMEKAQAAMLPWFEKVKAARLKSEAEFAVLGVDPTTLPSGKALEAAQRSGPKLARRLAASRVKLSGKLTRQLRRDAAGAIKAARELLAEPKRKEPFTDAELVPELERLEKVLAGVATAGPKKAWLDRLDAIVSGLKSDPKLVFGAKRKSAEARMKIAEKRKKSGKPRKQQNQHLMETVSEPSMAQLADTGWFSVKPSATNAEAFDEEFFVAMVKHGFNPLATSNQPDSMHFELRWNGPAKQPAKK